MPEAAPVKAPEAVAAAPDPEPAVAAASDEVAVPAEDESSTDGYAQPRPRLPRTTATTWMYWTANCSSTLAARSCART